MNVLFITDRIPYPPVSGNLLRTYNLCRRIARDHQLWLAIPLNNPEEAKGISHMQEFCHQVITARRRHRSPFQHLPGLVRYTLADKPLEYKFEHCEELVHQIQDLTATFDFDVVHIEPSYMGLYLEALSPKSRAKSFLTFHNIESSLYSRIARVERAPVSKFRAWLHSLMLQRWEANYTSRFDQCITVSESDQELLLAANPQVRVTVLPNGVDTDKYRPLSQSDGSPNLVFVGSMNYSACVDAMIYFCHEILPLIRQTIEDVQMWIVGRDPAPEVRQLAGEGVHVTGWVEDVVPYYQKSTTCVVPLRAGGGTRLKILEAMALGRPVVSTSIGCEGLDVVDGEHLLIANTPELFATKTVQLLTEVQFRQQMVAKARQLVVDHYDWEAITRRLIETYGASIKDTDPRDSDDLVPAHQSEGTIR